MADETQYQQLKYTAPPGATSLMLVRHGESQSGAVGSFALVDGQGDPGLAERGLQEAELVGARLAGAGITAVYASTLIRTQQTAAPLARALGLEVVIDADLREVFMGEWEGGLYRKKIAEQDPIAVQMMAEESWAVIPGAEPADRFAERLRGAVTRIARAHPGERVAVFSHAAAIGEILAQAARSRPFAFLGATNAAISEMLVTGDQWVIRSFNDGAHL
jgi:probable phosphoglycerate mutase